MSERAWAASVALCITFQSGEAAHAIIENRVQRAQNCSDWVTKMLTLFGDAGYFGASVLVGAVFLLVAEPWLRAVFFARERWRLRSVASSLPRWMQ